MVLLGSGESKVLLSYSCIINLSPILLNIIMKSINFCILLNISLLNKEFTTNKIFKMQYYIVSFRYCFLLFLYLSCLFFSLHSSHRLWLFKFSIISVSLTFYILSRFVQNYYFSTYYYFYLLLFEIGIHSFINLLNSYVTVHRTPSAHFRFC